MSVDKFELATRQKYRFPSTRGELTVEQLWDLKLTERTGFNLDEVAKTVNAELQQESTTSFVKKESGSRKQELETKLEIVKHIISVKLSALEEASKAAEKRQQRETLQAALQRRKDSDLEGLSAEEIEARIKALE